MKDLDDASKASEIYVGEDGIADEGMVRSRVHDLTRLAEMRWRYRAVEKGESPHDSAVELLEHARALIECRRLHVLSSGGIVDAHAGVAAVTAGGGSSGADAAAAAAAAFRKEWAAELSAVLHGLCATRLIFKTGDDTVAESQLHEALALRQEAGLLMELADSLNSLGLLKQKQRAYDEAEAHYRRSLELREKGAVGGGAAASASTASSNTTVGGGGRKVGKGGRQQQQQEEEQAEEAEKVRHQMIAQSLVSLGNLDIERGDIAASRGEGGGGGGGAGGGGADPSATSSARHYVAARAHFEAAATAYVRGFHEGHPKVAWAHEGLGRLHEKEGNLHAAVAAYERAAEIRRALQGQDTGKQLFQKELEIDEDRLSALRAQLAAGGAATGAAASCPTASGEDCEVWYI